ncbi:hypothetical protein JANAI62_35520 [Jannaschia pagri]|uniref:Uncharacterized protein n=1 Tax=Jannaschia pagri TaxID=2829797 RepID=A0ABQ4NRQ0_9RHOB|nr:hypothetical protein JANAI61_36220 [Jannaschia sp. AI_61]GIT96929.1 hypothetical protein JANAI62_35520 [Jannaschia sp. AI_62]
MATGQNRLNNRREQGTFSYEAGPAESKGQRATSGEKLIVAANQMSFPNLLRRPQDMVRDDT